MCAPRMYVHRCIYMCLPMHVHTQMHIHVCPLHVQTQVYILMHPMHIHTQGAYMCAFHACMCTPVFQGCVWVPTWHTWSRAVFTLWCFMLISLPSACGFYHLPVYLQGIDRSHSWVNSAYAPGGSKAVLRRAPPYCGADPRQVPSLLAPARV